uniref:hypothetical protein n=1 Tax=Microcoleus sp. LEGE 07076 TaxID=915322 RepID=UPI001880BBB7|nr:hypothetical protein [Microcoleus sp. LEGE 07076]
MSDNQKIFPVGFCLDSDAIKEPFVINWSEPDAAEKFEGSTKPSSDTCFTQMASAGLFEPVAEKLSTTSFPTGGETGDTTFGF